MVDVSEELAKSLSPFCKKQSYTLKIVLVISVNSTQNPLSLIVCSTQTKNESNVYTTRDSIGLRTVAFKVFSTHCLQSYSTYFHFDWKSIHKLLHSVYIRFHISNNLERVAGIQTSRPGHLFRSYMAAQINPYSSHTDFYTTPARLRSSPPSERRNLRQNQRFFPTQFNGFRILKAAIAKQDIIQTVQFRKIQTFAFLEARLVHFLFRIARSDR